MRGKKRIDARMTDLMCILPCELKYNEILALSLSTSEVTNETLLTDTNCHHLQSVTPDQQLDSLHSTCLVPCKAHEHEASEGLNLVVATPPSLAVGEDLYGSVNIAVSEILFPLIGT